MCFAGKSILQKLFVSLKGACSLLRLVSMPNDDGSQKSTQHALVLNAPS